jgi:hypothetical protein
MRHITDQISYRLQGLNIFIGDQILEGIKIYKLLGNVRKLMIQGFYIT